MTEKTHFQSVVDHVMSDDISEISNLRAERDYALHCLEREITICAQTQARNEALVKALESIRDYRAPVNSARPIVAFASHARAAALAALASIKETTP